MVKGHQKKKYRKISESIEKGIYHFLNFYSVKKSTIHYSWNMEHCLGPKPMIYLATHPSQKKVLAPFIISSWVRNGRRTSAWPFSEPHFVYK
jgi:hypothetical protein